MCPEASGAALSIPDNVISRKTGGGSKNQTPRQKKTQQKTHQKPKKSHQNHTNQKKPHQNPEKSIPEDFFLTGSKTSFHFLSILIIHL